MGNKPFVLSYYTKGTPYEDHAPELKNSLKKAGLNFCIEGVPDTGDWSKNTRLKAKYIRDVVESHLFEDFFLSLDIDVVYEGEPDDFSVYAGKSPLFLDTIPPSKIHLHTNAAKYRGEALKCGGMMQSGILAMNRSDELSIILKEWEKVCKNTPSGDKTWDQILLQRVIRKSGLSVHVGQLLKQHTVRGNCIKHLRSSSHAIGGNDTHKVLILGSAPDAPSWWKKHKKEYINGDFLICALNNAWQVVYDDVEPIWLRPNDFDGPRPLDERMSENRDGWRMAPHWVKDGRISMVDAILHVLNVHVQANRRLELHVSGMDCNYSGTKTHFYGKGNPDPLKYGEKWLDKTLMAVRNSFETSGAKIVNASDSPITRLPFERLS